MLAILGALLSPAHAGERPEAAVLLDRLCANSLRANEEDRLYGLISLTVRATIKYWGAIFSPDLIDDAVQDGLGALIEACPQRTETDDAHRLGVAVDLVRDATESRIEDKKAAYSIRQTDQATAADLSQELSAPEIDAWLDALPARKRALALFLYASDLTREEISDALGVPPASLVAGLRDVKTDLLKFFRHEWEAAPRPPAPEEPGLDFREQEQSLAALLATGTAGAATARITGISRDLYAWWSLLATVTGLRAGRGIALGAPILLEPESPERARMIAVALEEIFEPEGETRRFLVKAYAIDGEKSGSGLRDGFRPGAATVDNAAARETLRRRGLAAIEIAHCLSFDYETAPDPGLCR